MRTAHDVFSETNPAFCAYALASFTAAFQTLSPDGPELPVAYLSLPITLSGDLSDTFLGTNKNTGLLEWLERSPKIQVDLAERIDGCMSMVTEAIRFGCFTRVLTVNTAAQLCIGDRKLKKSSATKSDEISASFRRAERLGYWFAAAGSTKTTFDMMGLTV